jgi:hypothetical protein
MQIAPFVGGGFGRLAGIKMILPGGARHQLAAAGFPDSFGRSFVGFDFRHICRSEINAN